MLVSVCICTYRRETLVETLRSIQAQVLPTGVDIEIVVVDNDAEGSARVLVDTIAKELVYSVRYFREPARGLSLVRNRALKMARGDWLALIDDDEVADRMWLSALLSTAKKFSADAVIGEVKPIFETPPPPWILSNKVFDLWIPKTGNKLGMGEAKTGNALINASFLKTKKIFFDPSYNTTGGEDSDFFRKALDRGALIVSSREAIVRELIPKERMTPGFLVRRSLRVGETYAKLTHRHGGMAAVATCIPRSAVNVVAAAALTVVCLPLGRSTYYRFYLLFVRNLGKFRYFLQLPSIELYGKS